MTAKIKQKRNKRQFYIPDGLMGTLAALAATAACFWRIPVTNLISDEGNAYLSVAQDWFLLLLSLCSAGVSLAVSAMIGVRIDRGRIKGAKTVVSAALAGGIVIGAVVCALCIPGAVFVTGTINRLPLAALAFRIFLVSLIPLTALCVLAGGMDGFGNVRSHGFVRLIFFLILTISGYFIARPALTYGNNVGALLQNSQYGPAYGAMGAAGAFPAAAIASLPAAFVLWQSQRSLRNRLAAEEREREVKEKRLVVTVLQRRLTWMLPSLLLTAALAGQSILFIRISVLLEQKDYLRHWGIFTGKSRVILSLPIIAAAAFALRQFPGLKLGFESRNLKRTRERCMISLRCTALFTVPCAAFFAVLSGPLTAMFFQTGDQEFAASGLRNGSVCVVLYGIAVMLGFILISSELLQSLVADMLLALILHLAALFVMLRYAGMGTGGVIAANILFSALLCLLFTVSIQKHMRLRLNWLRVFLAPVIGTAFMAAVCAFLSHFLSRTASAAITVAVSFVVGILFYFVVETVLHGVTQRELKEFPGGDRIAALARLLRLM